MTDIYPREGRLLKDLVVFVKKMFDEDFNRLPDQLTKALAGERVVWVGPRKDKYKELEYDLPGTTEGVEHMYGGRFLYWIDVPAFGLNVGAELGVDFEWSDNG